MRDALAAGRPGILTYGIVPPKRSWEPERVSRTAKLQTERIAALPVDGVVIYDLQDESARTDAPRPFPYEETVDPVAYAYDHLGVIDAPRVVYRCVAKLSADELDASLRRIDAEGGATVLVGAASRRERPAMRLPEAHALRRDGHPQVPVGGVLIGERHGDGHTEHERVLRKVDEGCAFFVTQAVYATTPTLDVLSDLHLRCGELGVPVPPVLVTLTPCGSERTLTFLRWLGVEVPRWLANELLHAEDTLARSVDLCAEIFASLWSWARDHDVPLGANIESVSIARAEIDASVELVHRVARIMGR